MDDADLAHNFIKFRRRYWIRHGLWIPKKEHISVTFEKIKKRPEDIGKPALLGECDGYTLRISPLLKHVWVQAHTTLLHEMAHLYIGVSTNWDCRFRGHGEKFKKEIDRLYSLGAFRQLI
jgi:hypothetical protein